MRAQLFTCAYIPIYLPTYFRTTHRCWRTIGRPGGVRATTQKAAIETHSEANEELRNRQTNIRNLQDLVHGHTAVAGHIYTREDWHYAQNHGFRTRRYLQGCGAQKMSREELAVACPQWILISATVCSHCSPDHGQGPADQQPQRVQRTRRP